MTINLPPPPQKKCEFFKNRKAPQIDDKEPDEKEPDGTKNALKYFIRYNDSDIIGLLCVRLPEMTGYAKKLNENATMSFGANNKQLLKNYKKIWEKVE